MHKNIFFGTITRKGRSSLSRGGDLAARFERNLIYANEPTEVASGSCTSRGSSGRCSAWNTVVGNRALFPQYIGGGILYFGDDLQLRQANFFSNIPYILLSTRATSIST